MRHGGHTASGDRHGRRRGRGHAELSRSRCPSLTGKPASCPGHAPLLGALVSGVVRYTAGGAEHYCAVSPGTVNVAANTVTVLARTAEPAPDIDLARAEAALRRAESDLEARGMEMNVSAAEAAQRPRNARASTQSELWRKNG
ncbi:MAG: F0F1 ATP synthase subunit epsilon [Oscillospiraceae bacterium]